MINIGELPKQSENDNRSGIIRFLHKSTGVYGRLKEPRLVAAGLFENLNIDIYLIGRIVKSCVDIFYSLVTVHGP